MKRLLSAGLAALLLTACTGQPETYTAEIRIDTPAPVAAVSARLEPKDAEICASSADGYSNLTGTLYFRFEESEFLEEPGILALTVWAPGGTRKATDCAVNAPRTGKTDCFRLTGDYQNGFTVEPA